MSEKHYVYIIQMGKKGAIKVGIAKSVKSRLAALQTANPSNLYELARFPMDSKKSALALEKSLHYRFRAFRLRGEWFDRKAMQVIPKETIPSVEKAICNMELDRKHLASIENFF